ncbi:MAG: MarR family transcriptional regulator [Clostridia bacterium]|nr:MarR family transcriptional regulator [Clostridia bacterium]
MERFESLKLKNQLCFPLYAVSKEIVKRYRPLLETLDLTYTQYIVMMVLWEKESSTVKDLGEKLFLDSGTLTPVLKSLEKKGFVRRERDRSDERVVNVFITDEGMNLRQKAVSVPPLIAQCISLTAEEAMELYRVLYKLIGELYGRGNYQE